MSQSPLDEFNQLSEDKKLPNEEPVHSIHRIFTFAVTLVKRNVSVVLPFILFCMVLNMAAEGYFKSSFASLNIQSQDILDLMLGSASPDLVEKMNTLAAQLLFVNLAVSTIVALIYSNLAAYIASGNANKGVGDFSRVVGFIMTNTIALAVIVALKWLLMGIGLSLLIIPGVMVYLYLLFTNFIFIFERKSVWECFVKSMELMDGVKMNFITFISYAALVFIPVWLLNATSGGSIYLVSFFIEGDAMAVFSIKNIILASISVVLREFIWLVYTTGVCLLYLKRCKD